MPAERVKRSLGRNEHHGPTGDEQEFLGKSTSSGSGRHVLAQNAQIGIPRVPWHYDRSNAIEAAPFDFEAVLAL
jgi:hypothetical protein